MPISHHSKSDTMIWDFNSLKKLSEKHTNSSKRKNKNLMPCLKKMSVSKLSNISEPTRLTSELERENGNASLVKIWLQLSIMTSICLLSLIFQNSATQCLSSNQVENHKFKVIFWKFKLICFVLYLNLLVFLFILKLNSFFRLKVIDILIICIKTINKIINFASISSPTLKD